MKTSLLQIRRLSRRTFAAILAAAFCCAMTLPVASHAAPLQTGSAKPHLPPYHTHRPRGPLPHVLPWTEFAGNACAENAYYFAAQIRSALYQQPCYCPCSQELGHTCLLDCFTRADKHAATCATCLEEAIFTYRQTIEGANARTIRSKIIKGEWKKVDLAKYTRPPVE